MAISANDEILLPYLFEIAEKTEAAGTILTGGLGLRLKQKQLRGNEARTLFQELPSLRPTADLDLFLRIDLWLEPERALAFRAMLKELDYRVASHSWHFTKPFREIENHLVKLDLQARRPLEGEAVKVKKRQVGKEMGTELAGLLTEEAFAVDDDPIPLSLRLDDKEAMILVPHPYAWLNLKLRAAHDWLRERNGEIPRKPGNEEGESRRMKHVYDVYGLVGMMTEEELERASKIGERYSDHPTASMIRKEAVALYGSPDSPGCDVIRAYDNGAWSDHLDENYGTFWDALSQSIGIKDP